MARQTLEYAYNQGMTQGDYAFVMLQLDLERFKRNMDKPGQIYVLMDLDKDKTCDYYQALESVVLVEVQSKLPDEKKSYEAFEKKVKEKYDSFKTNLTASLEKARFNVSFIVNELGGVGVGDMWGENCIKHNFMGQRICLVVVALVFGSPGTESGIHPSRWVAYFVYRLYTLNHILLRVRMWRECFYH